MSLDNESKDVVNEHKTQLLLTGNLSDFQLTNLKKWPLILFENINSVSIHYNFHLDEKSVEANALGLHAGIITYDFDFNKNARITKKQKEQKLNKLVFWTKFLFWNDTQVIFKRKGRKWTL
jgi:hypothetical protein